MELVKKQATIIKKNQWKKKLGIAAKEFTHAALIGAASAAGTFLFNRVVQRQSKSAIIHEIRRAS